MTCAAARQAFRAAAAGQPTRGMHVTQELFFRLGAPTSGGSAQTARAALDASAQRTDQSASWNEAAVRLLGMGSGAWLAVACS